MAGEDKGYLAWLRACPCALSGKDPCNGPIEAHHNTHGVGAEKRGMSQKTDDRRAFPLCLWHHRTFHDLTGYFRRWVKSQRNQWQDDNSTLWRKRYKKDPEIF